MTWRVAVIGGGISGASAASTLAKLSGSRIAIHVFDQGRNGVGGRSSHREIINEGDCHQYQWDHGCQFFRADTPQFQQVVREWIEQGFVHQWTGNFVGKGDFFGCPSQPPFYVGVGGMHTISKSLLFSSPPGDATIEVHSGQRVSDMERDPDGGKWRLMGTSGDPAFHDSAESVAQSATKMALGDAEYDAVILTDISSSFSPWHRASAGVPAEFANRVLHKVGSRVPLFACMLAFETDIPIASDFCGGTIDDDDTLWFVARSKSKPGLHHLKHDCWTLVSTPEYAMRQIEENPMQDPTTGAFVPQSKEYLTTIPGPDLEAAFRKVLLQEKQLGPLDGPLPKTLYMNAQRWGSALAAHRHLDETSPTRKIISNVAYDSGRGSLAPTRQETQDLSFVADEDIMLFQAGDMVSSHTPGFEGAALSGVDVANRVYSLLTKK